MQGKRFSFTFVFIQEVNWDKRLTAVPASCDKLLSADYLHYILGAVLSCRRSYLFIYKTILEIYFLVVRFALLLNSLNKLTSINAVYLCVHSDY